MKILNLVACIFALGAAVAAVLPQAFAEDTRFIELSLAGLPADPGSGTILVKAIRMRDLVITPVLREQADSIFWIEVPSVPVILSGKYFSLDPPLFLKGSIPSYSEETIEMNFGTGGTGIHGLVDFPLHPPAHGRAIGVRDENFTATGPGAAPYMESGLADMVIAGLVAHECPSAGDNSFVVVATPGSRDYDEVVAEINRQHTPDFDQDTIVEPHFTSATHYVHGGYIFEGNDVSVGLWIEDGAGNTIASAAASGPKSNLFDIVDTAIAALAKETCEGKPWEGTITVEEHDSGHIPDAQDPKNKPGADFTSDLSVTCTFYGEEEAECTASTSGSLIGNGASIVSNASGSAQVHAGISVVNGEVSVSVGRFRIKGSQTVSVEGFTSTDPIEVDVGPYSAKARASGSEKSEGGSVTEGKRTISWSAQR